jgi:hypothetical protein
MPNCSMINATLSSANYSKHMMMCMGLTSHPINVSYLKIIIYLIIILLCQPIGKIERNIKGNITSNIEMNGKWNAQFAGELSKTIRGIATPNCTRESLKRMNQNWQNRGHRCLLIRGPARCNKQSLQNRENCEKLLYTSII